MDELDPICCQIKQTNKKKQPKKQKRKYLWESMDAVVLLFNWYTWILVHFESTGKKE